MKINFQIKSLEFKKFEYLFNLTDIQLIKINAKKLVVDESPGYPCRISLEDAKIGETIIAMSFMHHDVDSPYKSSGPIFIRQNSATAKININELPKVLENRHLSLRAYDSKNMMVNALTVQGNDIGNKIQYLFADNIVEYIHIHNANPGCFSCSVDRV